MKIYIAGRISGDDHYREKFERAARILVKAGFEPVNPVTIDHRNHAPTWEGYMIADLKAMLDCDAVYALADWRGSKGATIEIQLALRVGKTVIWQDEMFSQRAYWGGRVEAMA